MKRILMLSTLVCVISSSALAGDIPSVPGPQAAPGGPTQASSTAPGDIPTLPGPGQATDQVTEAVVSAVLAVLGIFAV
jgi:hypothetical protein